MIIHNLDYSIYSLERVLTLKFQLFQKKESFSFIAHLKAPKKRISEWVCLLSLDKRFQKYSSFSNWKNWEFSEFLVGIV